MPNADAPEGALARRPAGVSVPAFLVGLIITGLLSAAGSYWYAVRAASKLVQVVATPVAILDANQLIHATILDNSVVGDRGVEGLARVRHVADKLMQDGYIVVDAQGVLAAPAQYYAPALGTAVEMYGPRDQSK